MLGKYSISVYLSSADQAACNLCAGVAGRLCVKIIRIAVDHYASPKDIPNPEPIRSHRHMGVAVQHQQRRQIARMPGMAEAVGIIVAARLRKARAGAAVSIMNVKAEEAGFTVLRQAGNVGLHQHAARFLIKPNLAVDIRRVRSASHVSHRIRASEVLIHKITSLQRMPEGEGLCQKMDGHGALVMCIYTNKNCHIIFAKALRKGRFFTFSGAIQANAQDMSAPKPKCSGYERDFLLVYS